MKPVKPVQGKTLIVGLLAAIIVVGGLLFWVGMNGGSTHVPLSRPGVGFGSEDSSAADAGGENGIGSGSAGWDGGAIQKTIVDHKVRDELRKRILASWATEGDSEQAHAAKEGRFIPAPTGPDGGRMDPQYIQEVVRGDFMPMAEKCYEELLARSDAAAGRVELSFTIVADPKLGGIVEDVEAESEGGVADEKMSTCMRESMSSLAFRPPAHGGYVTVVYPVVFSPGDEPPPDH